MLIQVVNKKKYVVGYFEIMKLKSMRFQFLPYKSIYINQTILI
jgi:hypothetical protein